MNIYSANIVWSTCTFRFIDNDDEVIEEHESVHKARLGLQQPSHVSLEDCLKLFTKEEKVAVYISK